MRNRVEYGSDYLLDEVVTDAGMHLERIGEGHLFLLGYRADGSSIALNIEGRICLVEERPAPDHQPEPARMVFGRVSVEVAPDGDIVLSRTGSLGRGQARVSRMWCIEQVEAALISARSRRGSDAVCEVNALMWALRHMRARGQS